ncbi:unnamed protein product [Rangifer tarandus platyrhynchus]|uniref:Uncharacterized protein n=1 Tax=Rangifer tarandus platyrhynchus TaxID=3082113 RepID=A0AC59ZVC1_RANTA
MFHVLFIHSSADGHFELCVLFLSCVLENTAMGICEQVLVWTRVLISLGAHSGVGLLGALVTVFALLKNCWTVFWPILHPGRQCPKAPISIFAKACYCLPL